MAHLGPHLNYGSAPVGQAQDYVDQSTPKEHSFYPYTDNGGSIVGLAGPDFVLVAGDTRSTSGYNINSRLAPKVFQIPTSSTSDGPTFALAVVGFAADGTELLSQLSKISIMYEFQHGKGMGIAACAQRLSHLLYQKRFFPYQVQAILAGIDSEGKGALYSYDPVGCYKREDYSCAGSAASLMMPVLDSVVGRKNQHVPRDGDRAEVEAVEVRPLELDDALKVVKDVFTGAAERQIEVGDGLQILCLKKKGCEEQLVALKRD